MATDAPPAAVPAADAAADAGAGASAAATEKLSDALVPIHKELLDLRDTLKAMQEAKTPPTEEALQPLQERLDAVDNKRVDGIFGGSLKTVIPEGQAILHELMDEAYDLVSELVVKASEMPPEMKQIYDTLCGLKRKLQKMKADRSYSLEDIHHYQLMVDAIDSRRVDGIFAGNLQSIPPGQAQCSTVLFQVYELLRILLGSAHEMNAEMRGIYTHLIGIKRKLIELKSKHVKHSTEDLHIYQLQLDAIDRDRVDGIFVCAAAFDCHVWKAEHILSEEAPKKLSRCVIRANMKWESSRPLSIPSSPSHSLHADSVLALPLSSPLLHHPPLTQPPPPTTSPLPPPPPLHVSVGRQAAHLAEVFAPSQRFTSVPSIPQSVPATRPAAPKRGSSGSFKERLQPGDSRAASAALAVPAIPAASAASDSEAATRLSAASAGSGGRSVSSAAVIANSASFGGRSSLGDRLGTTNEEYGSETFFWRVDVRAQELVAQWRDVTDLASPPPSPPPPLVALERRLDEAEEWLGAAVAALGAQSRSFVRAAAAGFPHGRRWESAAARRLGQARLSLEGGRSPVGLRGIKVRLAVSGRQAEGKEAEEQRLQGEGAESERRERKGEREGEGKGVRVRGGVPEQLLCGGFAGIVSHFSDTAVVKGVLPHCLSVSAAALASVSITLNRIAPLRRVSGMQQAAEHKALAVSRMLRLFLPAAILMLSHERWPYRRCSRRRPLIHFLLPSSSSSLPPSLPRSLSVSPIPQTHLISSNGLPGAHKTAGSVFSAVMAKDGWKGFFRGNGVNCLRVGPHKAVELCTFEMLKRLLGRPGHPLQHVAAPVSGAAAGLAGTLLTYPLELIRTRISVQPELYRDLGSTVRKIVQEEGALSLYRGIVPSLLGVVPYAATNYFVYDALRTAYRKATGREQVPNEATLLFGAAAASASSAVTFPLEVVRRRLQLGVTATGAGAAGRQTAVTILKGIIETEGVWAVYRGLGTTWLKLLPAAGISFVCYEAARVALRVDDASMARGQERKGGSSGSGSSNSGSGSSSREVGEQGKDEE
ncbi:unnamed protein product [Closterium sp. NIES-54]